MSADLAAVLHHDVTLNDEHPPLPKVLAVLPVLFAHPLVPANGRWSGNDELRYGARRPGGDGGARTRLNGGPAPRSGGAPAREA